MLDHYLPLQGPEFETWLGRSDPVGAAHRGREDVHVRFGGLGSCSLISVSTAIPAQQQAIRDVRQCGRAGPAGALCRNASWARTATACASSCDTAIPRMASAKLLRPWANAHRSKIAGRTLITAGRRSSSSDSGRSGRGKHSSHPARTIVPVDAEHAGVKFGHAHDPDPVRTFQMSLEAPGFPRVQFRWSPGQSPASVRVVHSHSSSSDAYLRYIARCSAELAWCNWLMVRRSCERPRIGRGWRLGSRRSAARPRPTAGRRWRCRGRGAAAGRWSWDRQARTTCSGRSSRR